MCGLVLFFKEMGLHFFSELQNVGVILMLIGLLLQILGTMYTGRDQCRYECCSSSTRGDL